MSKDLALKAGIKLAAEKGLINVSRADICTAADIPDGSWARVVGMSFTELLVEIKKSIGDEKYFLVSKKRVSPELRKENIMQCAMKLAEKHGYTKISSTLIAEAAGISHVSVIKYFGTMQQLRNDIMRKAVKTRNLKIVAQGLCAGDKQAKKADQSLKEEALKCLI